MAQNFLLQSPAFRDQQMMPPKYTCEGSNVSPPLHWDNLPAGTKSLALLVEDPDAPDPKKPKRIWVHWIVYNIPPATKSLGEDIEDLPEGANAGVNDWKQQAWGGPCPPIGKHRYIHKLFALDTKLEFPKPPGKAELLQAMKGHILAEADLTGLYQKHKH